MFGERPFEDVRRLCGVEPITRTSPKVRFGCYPVRWLDLPLEHLKYSAREATPTRT